MKIFLSALENGNQCYKKDPNGKCKELAYYLKEEGVKFKWNLMSYYYIGKSKFELASFIRDNSEGILIDSGAHSFQKGKKVDWVKYTHEYADFIRKFDRPNVVGYFEMDVDGIMGCEKFPRIYQEAYDQLEIGKAYYVLLNQCAYKMYNLTGDTCHKEDNVTFYGVEYFGNHRMPITDKTIGVHWDENTWFESWTGGFQYFDDFVPFAIHTPTLDEDLTMKWFGYIPEDKKLTITNGVNVDINLMELGNYFMNPKVVKLTGDGFVFEKVTAAKHQTQTKVLENGCEIEFEVC